MHVVLVQLVKHPVVLQFTFLLNLSPLKELLLLKGQSHLLQPFLEPVPLLLILIDLMPDIGAVQLTVSHQGLLNLGEALVKLLEAGFETLEFFLGRVFFECGEFAFDEVSGLFEAYFLAYFAHGINIEYN